MSIAERFDEKCEKCSQKLIRRASHWCVVMQILGSGSNVEHSSQFIGELTSFTSEKCDVVEGNSFEFRDVFTTSWWVQLSG